MAQVLSHSARVVLRDEVERDQLDDLAQRVGWRLSNVIPATAELPAQVIFSTRQALTHVFMVEDARLGAAYLMATGPECAKAEAHCRQLPHVDRDQLAEMLKPSASRAVRCRGLGLLVLLAGAEPEEGDPKILCDALQHADEVVRTSALTACSYAPWPALDAALRRVRQDDATASLRHVAQQLLAARGGP
jgi:hypothetical protein